MAAILDVRTSAADDGSLRVDVSSTCPKCGRVSSVSNIPAEGFFAWNHRDMDLDAALPELTGSEREFLLTGLHPACQDRPGLALHGLVDCRECGTTYEGAWTDESDTVQDMDGSPEQDQVCPGCGHVQLEIWPGWAFRSEAG